MWTWSISLPPDRKHALIVDHEVLNLYTQPGDVFLVYIKHRTKNLIWRFMLPSAFKSIRIPMFKSQGANGDLVTNHYNCLCIWRKPVWSLLFLGFNNGETVQEQVELLQFPHLDCASVLQLDGRNEIRSPGLMCFVLLDTLNTKGCRQREVLPAVGKCLEMVNFLSLHTHTHT